MNNNTNPANNRKEQKTNAVTNTTSMAVLVAPGLALAAVAMAAVLWSGGAGLAQTTSPGPGPDQARAEAIRGALAVIEKQLAAHGGTWEKWAEDLKPYRDDIRGVTALKWPWPAKNGYVFQGAAHALHLRDSFDNLPDGERPLEGLVHFSRQLKALGIDLIVAIIPAKLTVYPDYLYAAVEGPQRAARAPEDRIVSLALVKLMYDLLRNNVEVVNLHEEFRQFRLKNGDDVPLFYVGDAHYLNRGAQLAAEKIAERLKRYDFVQKALAGENPFVTEKGARTDGAKADKSLLLIKNRDGRPYRNIADSPVFVLGDSHMGYNKSTAPFSGQIAFRIAMPVSEMWREGLSASIPVEVAKDPNLKKRRVVVVHYSERMMRPKNGEPKWPVLKLPGVDQAQVSAAAQEDPVRLLTASRDSLTKQLNDRITADATREAPLDVVLDLDEALVVYGEHIVRPPALAAEQQSPHERMTP